MGCFWGAERLLWKTPGVVVTAVGYQGGRGNHPTYEQVCRLETGHVEVVKVVWDPRQTDFETLVRVFFENHDPTQGNRQGNDHGTQYRSAIFVDDPTHLEIAHQVKASYQQGLSDAGFGPITTEIRADAGPFWLAEDYHQQYLAKNPGGYCGIGGTGVSCPTGLELEG